MLLGEPNVYPVYLQNTTKTPGVAGVGAFLALGIQYNRLFLGVVQVRAGKTYVYPVYLQNTTKTLG